jgi:hypothetical protein
MSSPSYTSTGGAFAHGRTLFHDVNETPPAMADDEFDFSPASLAWSAFAAFAATARQPSLSGSGLVYRAEALSAKAGGARRDRTDDLMLAKHALSQLSYGPDPHLSFAGWLAEP